MPLIIFNFLHKFQFILFMKNWAYPFHQILPYNSDGSIIEFNFLSLYHIFYISALALILIYSDLIFFNSIQMNIRVRIITGELTLRLSSRSNFILFFPILDGPLIDFRLLLFPEQEVYEFFVFLNYLFMLFPNMLPIQYLRQARHLFLLMIFKTLSISGLNHFISIKLISSTVSYKIYHSYKTAPPHLPIKSVVILSPVVHLSFFLKPGQQSRISIGVYRGARVNLLSDCHTHFLCFVVFNQCKLNVRNSYYRESHAVERGNKSLPQIKSCPEVGISKYLPQSLKNPSNLQQKFVIRFFY